MRYKKSDEVKLGAGNRNSLGLGGNFVEVDRNSGGSTKLKPSTYRVPIVCPRAKFHKAGLLIEGEVLHVDLAK